LASGGAAKRWVYRRECLGTQVQRKARVVQVILNSDSLDFVNIEQQEAGLVLFDLDFKSPNFARVAEAMGAKGIRLEEPGVVKEAWLRRWRTRMARSSWTPS
jgi:thiamine pyrophosphate-dependent acetolactate synthase large subunit-like protein